MFNPKLKPVMLALAGVIAATSSVYAADKAIKASAVDVVSTTPLKGIGLSINKIPANIQIASPKDVNAQSGVSLADYMSNNMQGVTVSDMSGNPYQPEINFRGYSASSLLGTPQGMSTYVDGVRVNEPFGDVTLWDKIPSFAIGGMQLVPGSNPLYGLNTLGGAIAIQTKSGRDAQGAALEYETGSWGRQRALAEYGGVSKDNSVDYYIGYQHSTENGWRKYSPSHVNQLFSKIGWQNESSKLDLSYIGTDNNLIGNGFTPDFLLTGDRDQIHTRPDYTNNYYHHLALNGSHWLNEDTMLSGNVYYRKSNRHTINGDLWEAEVDHGEHLAGYENLGECNKFTVVSSSAVAADCELVGSVLNRTKTTQDNYGIAGQASFNQDLWGMKNQFVAGAGFDYTLMRFGQSEQINQSQRGDDTWMDNTNSTIGGNGRITPNGGLATDQVFDATRAPVMNGAGLLPLTKTVGLTGKQYTTSLFATDTLSFNDKWHLTGGLRWNYTKVDNVDTLRGSASSQTLTAKDSYSRVNPSIGLSHTPNQNVSLFGSYSESSRAPTSIELGCSNPENPCLLPSAMADDPPLNQVVAKTYDFGARGNLTDDLKWNASVYSATNHDDIQFIRAGSSTSLGYYNNVGRTKRQGFDLGLSGKHDKFKWNVSYGYIQAKYDSDFSLISASNSSSVGGVMAVKDGDYMSGIPKHQLKLRGQYQITPDWSIGTNVVAFSDQYAYGNENNKHQAGQCATEQGNSCAAGSGKVGGYAIVNLDTQYNIGAGWKAFAKAINIFDREYDVSARLMDTKFRTDTLAFDDEDIRVRGVIPSAPRAAWFGVRYEFSAPKAAQ